MRATGNERQVELALDLLVNLAGQTNATGVGDPIVPLLQAENFTTAAGMPKAAGAADPDDDDELEWASPLEAGRIMTARAEKAKEGPAPEFGSLRQACSNLLGYTFTSQSKQRLMESYAVSIQQHALGLVTGGPDEDSGPVFDEHEAFEYEYTRTGVKYSAPSGFHDDTVMAYALADWCRKLGDQWQTVGGADVAL